MWADSNTMIDILLAACPDNCLKCEMSGDDLICSQDGCAPGYGKLEADELCHGNYDYTVSVYL